VPVYLKKMIYYYSVIILYVMGFFSLQLDSRQRCTLQYNMVSVFRMIVQHYVFSGEVALRAVSFIFYKF